MTGHHKLLNLFVIRLWISAGLLDSFNHFPLGSVLDLDPCSTTAIHGLVILK